MSLETHIAGVEDALIDSLHFSGRNSASYVTHRREATFAPQSGGRFETNGIRLCRFSLADYQGFLDGSTVRLAMRIVNTGASPLVPIACSPACMFRRMRILCQTEVEDIDNYGRVFQMFHEMLPSQRKFNDITETWSGSEQFQTIQGGDGTNHGVTMAGLNDPAHAEPIAPGSERVVVVQLLSSLLSQGKMLPLNFMNAVLELELGEADDAFNGTGNSWSILEPRLLGSVLSLDNSLANSYAKHILDGKSLPITMNGLYCIKSSVSDQTQVTLPIVRGFTRLSTVYITFCDNSHKEVTTFLHPINGAVQSTTTDTFRYHLKLGAERMPDFDVSSVGEQFYRTRMAALIHHGTDSFGISSYQFKTTKGIFALNLERCSGAASHTGQNTRGGSQMTVELKNLGSQIQTMYVVCHYEQILNITSSGVDVLT